jgi:hypothetical protein
MAWWSGHSVTGRNRAGLADVRRTESPDYCRHGLSNSAAALRTASAGPRSARTRDLSGHALFPAVGAAAGAWYSSSLNCSARSAQARTYRVSRVGGNRPDGLPAWASAWIKAFTATAYTPGT